MAEWIWYPGEFEHRLANKVNTRRYFREHIRLPIWKLAPIYPYVKFIKKISLNRPETFIVRADGIIDVETGRNQWVPFYGGAYHLAPGEYELWVSVYVSDGKTATCYVQGEQIESGAGWQCTLQDAEIVGADFGGFTDIERSPNDFCLPSEPIAYVSREERKGFTLYDFGREVFGRVALTGGNGKGKIKLFFGESLQEALDFDNCILISELNLEQGESSTELGRAFRYLALVKIAGADYRELSAELELSRQNNAAVVRFADPLLQRIWDVSMYTLHLNTREFYLDAIKRDRWVWSGDASQCYLMNWYSFFDETTVRRTSVALSGKGALTQHINTVTDHTLYWLISFYENFFYTGDVSHVSMWAGRAFEIADFALSRCDENWRLRKRKGDWAFIDWGEGYAQRADSHSFIQILLYKALISSEQIALVVGEEVRASRYGAIAERVKEDLLANFYDEEKGAFIFGYLNGARIGDVLRQPNIMAVYCGIADRAMAETVVNRVLLNENIPALRTPYMRFYENAVLCMTGHSPKVLASIKEYWGGMLAAGATTFWEVFNPEETEEQRYAMYGDRYGKSLCQAWGASPLYLLGRWFFGLMPDEAGYRTYHLKPDIAELGDFEAELPIRQSRIRLACRDGELTVFCSDLDGSIEIGGQRTPIPRATLYRRKMD